jgi:hypothetical protein
MSLVTYPKSNESKASGAVSKKRVTQAGSGAPSTFSRRLRNAFAATGRLVINIFDAIAEARVQKAMIEAELYLNRYKHTSKNDDDLPVIR